MNQYLPLKSTSSKLGDEYYRCLVESLTRASPLVKIEECVCIARKYREALHAQLEDLPRLKDPIFIRREERLITEYLKLIDHDLVDFMNEGQIDPDTGTGSGLGS
jgi:hypothetical protein